MPRIAWKTLVGLVLGLTATGCRSELDRTIERASRSTVREIDPGPDGLALPVRQGSVRFAVIGDPGRGDTAQYDIATQMVAWRARFPFDFVVMLGDNVYPPHTPEDYLRKFDEPYKPLLEAGVTFHAAIGNHDDPAAMNYAKFNMGGQRYYTFRRSETRLAGLAGAGVRFFVLDTRSLDPGQLRWLEKELTDSQTAWKICYMHHPLYTSGRYQYGARTLRLALEPLLVRSDVDVVLSGHEHFYERLQPQHGISYFVSGAGGALRKGDIRPSGIKAAGYDEDCHFMLMEVTGSELYFQAIARNGKTVDAGVIVKQPPDRR